MNSIRRASIIIVLAAACAGGLHGQSPPEAAARTAWPVAHYQTYTFDQLQALPAAQAEINFDAIDYPLLHAAVLYVTNQERANHGRPPLAHHPALEEAAFGHSQDMRDHGFFSHTSVVSGKRELPDRTRRAGFPSAAVGENIAQTFGIAYDGERGVYLPAQNGGYFSYTYRGDPIRPHTYLSAARAVVDGWMNSPGHRENILRPGFTYLGVGAAYFSDAEFADIPTFYFTQNFGGR